jgi:hypothetical protein
MEKMMRSAVTDRPINPVSGMLNESRAECRC